jgi:hypothetical protein
MGLRKYMVYSFASLWTVVLVIALVAAIVHQVRFQDSATEIHLNWQVRSLEFQNQGLASTLRESEQMIIEILSVDYYE